jgi:hypothetical protein
MQHTPIEVLKAKSTEQKRGKKGRGEVMGGVLLEQDGRHNAGKYIKERNLRD